MTQWQVALMHKLIDLIVHAVLELIDQYVPKYYVHLLLARCWDALEAITIEPPPLQHYLVTRPLPGLNYTPEELRTQLSETARVLRYNIEIAEEGNSKAIRMIMLVTIVFLPLSFISSVFSMNTTDIGDMGSSQRLFWAIAILVIALIGGVSLVVAYYGTHMWDELRRTGNRLANTTVRLTYALPSRTRKQSLKDEEKFGDGEVVETLLLKSGTTRRRRMGLNVEEMKKRKEESRSNRANVNLGDMVFR
jgi:hypothetical protein